MVMVVNNGIFRAVDSKGVPLSNGKVYSYISGTTVERATYPTISDAIARTNANANPVVLNSSGKANIVLNGATRLVLKDQYDNLIYTVDGLDGTTQDVYDSNGALIILFGEVDSAVNEVTITNAATGNGPTIRATGDDNNVALTLASKGSSNLVLDGGTSGNVLVNSNSSGSITLGGATTVNGTLTNSGTSALTTITNTTLTSTTSNITTANITTGNVTTLNVSGNSTLTGNLSVGGILSPTTTNSFNILPAGVIMHYAGSSAPTGWLICDGSAISRTTYSALFAIISTSFGSGDGSTTFNLPNFQRNSAVGAGGSTAGGLSNTVGSTGGAETITIAAANLPTTVPYTSGSVSILVSGIGSAYVLGAASVAHCSGSAINQRPPALVMNFIIRAY